MAFQQSNVFVDVVPTYHRWAFDGTRWNKPTKFLMSSASFVPNTRNFKPVVLGGSKAKRTVKRRVRRRK